MQKLKDTASGRQQTPARERREWVKPSFGRINLASARGTVGPDDTDAGSLA